MTRFSPPTPQLFVDPFALYADDDQQWVNAHDRLIEFFNMALELVAKSGFKRSSARWRAAERLMSFPEPAEFCLGYGVTPFGSGTGEGYGAGILEGAELAIQAGVDEVAHFEELTLFEAGVGPDRISDIVCNVLKAHFVEYTQRVAKKHKIKTQLIPIRHARWDRNLETWIDERLELPLNPWTKRAVLLVPARFLRPLPTVEPSGFWDWAWEYRSADIRGNFNYDLGKNVNARVIAAFARANADLTVAYLSFLEGVGAKPPYDLETDPGSEYQWYDAGIRMAALAKLPEEPDGAAEFCKWVRELL